MRVGVSTALSYSVSANLAALDAGADDSPEGAVASAAVESASGGWVLVTGSLHLVGAVRGGLTAGPPPEEPGCSPSAQTSS